MSDVTNAIPLEITCQTVQQKLAAEEPFFFLDCREPDEYATAKIAGTTLLPMSQLADRAAEIDAHKNELVVVHCHHGGRSLRVAMWLRKQGFTQACSMAGGIDVWSQQIDPGVPRY
ncbi:MAG: rhodanese-like domain-containing protein [Planctomycetaceae bacterium]|nr:rhodanese-like domain-containing protein [Planctomycetaceae bacterium]